MKKIVVVIVVLLVILMTSVLAQDSNVVAQTNTPTASATDVGNTFGDLRKQNAEILLKLGTLEADVIKKLMIIMMRM